MPGPTSTTTTPVSRFRGLAGSLSIGLPSAFLMAGMLLAGASFPGQAAATLLEAEHHTDAAATMIYLRGDVVVEGPMVTLGDMLVGVPDLVADVPVARAPEPGASGRVRTVDLHRAAQRHGVDWQPFAESRTILVSRRGQMIDRSEMSRAVLEALEGQLDHDDYEIYLGGRIRDHYVPLDAIVDVVVESIDYRSDNGRFDAVLRLSHDHGGSPVRIAGHVIEMTELPMLRRRMQNGEIIAAEDITYRKVRADRVPVNVVTDATALIGRTPQRAIQASRNIRENDVIVPQDVLRNEMVTMVVNNGGMILTTTGQAMEAGARGAVIGVRNMRSKRVVRGVVIGPGEVHMLVGPESFSQRPVQTGAAFPAQIMAETRH